MTLGDESIVYARANYVKLFHHYNPKKFQESFDKVKNFDYITHRNVINNYDIAVRKLKPRDSVTKSFVSSCKDLAVFSKNLVDQAYPRAISHQSENDSLSNAFFNEINSIVKFDDAIGVFSKSDKSFNQYVKIYKDALLNYKNTFKSELIP